MEINKSKESAIPQQVLDLLKRKHQTVREDHKYNCTGVALEIAKVALENREDPVFLVATHIGRKKDASKRLTPKIHEGNVDWGSHTVCAIGNLVLDPIIGKPLSIEDYVVMAFEELATIEQTHSTDFLRKFFSK